MDKFEAFQQNIMATENKTDTASKMESVDIVKMFEMLVIENKRRDKIMEDMLHHIVQQGTSNANNSSIM